MKEEPRYMQDQYEKQANNDSYRDSRNQNAVDRRSLEHSLMVQRHTYTNGNAHSGRKQAGVEVLRGNPNAVFSSTKADGVRNRSYTTGVTTVNEEASKIDGAPIAPGNELPWEATTGSETTQEGEV